MSVFLNKTNFTVFYIQDQVLEIILSDSQKKIPIQCINQFGRLQPGYYLDENLLSKSVSILQAETWIYALAVEIWQFAQHV